MRQRLTTAGLLIVCAAIRVSGQVAGAKLQGTASDQSGAVIPAVNITIANAATGVSRTVETNAQGFYAAPNLAPGDYQVSATAAGFAKQVATGVTLTVGAEQTLNFNLTLGTASDRVDVSSPVPGVDLASSSLSNAINQRTIVELPLNARDWTALATLEPGVSAVRTQPGLAITNTRANRGLGGQLSVGGNRPQQNNYRLDGISISDYANGAPGSVLGVVLGVDSIQEFSVVTSNAPADYGRTAGGVVNSITRSGSNTVHGSAYEFLRNSALDARNFFDPVDAPPFKRNQFGASLGGPVIRDHTFLFANYEGLRQSLGQTLTNPTLSAAARDGHLAASTITVSPLVRPYLGLYPLPNGTVTGDSALFSFPAQQATTEDYFTIKADHVFSPVDSLSGTYLMDRGRTSGPDNFNNVLLGQSSRHYVGTVSETHIFGPRLLNTLRGGMNRVFSAAPQALKALNPLAADTALGFYPGVPVGVITVTGLANFQGGVGGIGEFDYHWNSYQFYDDAFLTIGTHAMKMGLALERMQSNETGSGAPYGNFTFGSIANFLANKPTNFKGPYGSSSSTRSIRQAIAAGYFEDDWKVLPNLTVNLGLRYEMSTVPSEAHGRLTSLISLTDTQTHLGSPFFNNPTTMNFEPRVGFAWDPFKNGKTSVRSAFGIYDVLPLPYLFELITLQSAPFYAQGNASNLAANTFPTLAVSQLASNNLRYGYVERDPRRNYIMQWNFNIQRQLTESVSLLAGYIGSRGVHQPYHGEDLNTVQPTKTAAGYVWPTPRGSGKLLNPLAGQISAVLWDASSNYNALNLKLVKRLSHGLQAQASYTWSKGIDTSSASVTGDTYTNSIIGIPFFDFHLTRGLSEFDIRHNFVGNFTWQLPSPPASMKLARMLAGGWQWGGILQVSTGQPFSVGVGGDALGLNSAVTFDFPDRINTPECRSGVNPGKLNYVNLSCFAYPNPSTRLGNSGRNILTGPNLVNADTSLFRTIPLRFPVERMRLQFRAELFNVFNHTNLSTPIRTNRDLFNVSGAPLGTGGLITNTATTSRQVQFGLKLSW